MQRLHEESFTLLQHKYRQPFVAGKTGLRGADSGQMDTPAMRGAQPRDGAVPLGALGKQLLCTKCRQQVYFRTTSNSSLVV